MSHDFLLNALHLRWCCSFPKSCPALCDPMDWSTPGCPVLHCLPEFAQMHVHWCHLTVSTSVACFSFCLQSFPASGSFLMSRLFTSGGQSIGASASASVLSGLNFQDWFPLGLTGLTSLQSKGLLGVFSNTTVKKHQFFSLSLLYGPTLTSIHDYWKNHSFD